jgi:hypothetical protein
MGLIFGIFRILGTAEKGQKSGEISPQGGAERDDFDFLIF